MAKYTPRKSRFLKKKPAKSTKKTLKKTEKKIVRMVSRKIEDKQAITYSNATFFNSSVDSSADMIQILPNISQGVADNQRIGDQITAKSLRLKGFIRFLPQPTNTVNTTHYGHVGIRMMVLSLKQSSNYTTNNNLLSNPLASLLRKGGTTVGFTGAISDLMAPINTDIFTKHYNKVIYVNQSYVITGDGSTNPKVAIDVSKLVRFFNIKINCRRKQLKYDNSTSAGLLPTNFAPFFVAGYSYMNGDPPDYTTTNLQISYDSIFDYEDA